jgi:hypothetical protein
MQVLLAPHPHVFPGAVPRPPDPHAAPARRARQPRQSGAGFDAAMLIICLGLIACNSGMHSLLFRLKIA